MFCSTIFYEAQKYIKKRIHVLRASAKSGVRNSPSDVCLVVYECRGEHKVRPPEQHLRNLRSVFCHSERKRRISFCHFWLDPKVTKRSRLRALHTPSRRLQVGKSGNSLRSDSLIFFRPARCSVGSPPEAHGRTPK